MKEIIENIQRKDIFEHNYNINDLIKQFSKFHLKI
jgi:hypothetical protein